MAGKKKAAAAAAATASAPSSPPDAVGGDWYWLMPLVSLGFAALFYMPLLLTLAVWAYPVPAVVLGVLYLPLYIDPVERDPSRSRGSKLILHSPLWRSCQAWLGLTMRKDHPDAEFDPERRRIVALHPHGINTYQMGLFISELGNFSGIFPGLRYPRMVMASVLFKIPVLRDLLLSYGAVDASKRTLVKVFEHGEDVLIVPGGSQEVLLSQPGHDTVYLERRKGFLKLALEQGADVVPTYTFGCNDAYSQVQNRTFRRVMSRIVSACGFVIPLYWGIWGTPVPYRTKQTMVVGDPIRVERTEPTQEKIDALHARYKEELLKLYERNKAGLGFGARNLVIV